MNIFLDTSTLFKLYHEESGTEELDKFFASHTIEKVYLSELAKLEFNSAASKKVRTKEITDQQADELIELLNNDFNLYTVIPLQKEVLNLSIQLLKKYRNEGLRTLDSIQLASVLIEKNLFIWRKLRIVFS